MKYLIFLATLFFANFANSQNILVEYNVLNLSNESKCELSITDTVTVFRVTSAATATYKDENFFIKKQNENSTYFNERFLNINFYVKDTLHCMKWQLTKDTMTILGNKCLSAISNFRGRDYIAFYSPFFAVSDGPWKFGGLPGLILSIKSVDNFIEWKATKIVQNSSASLPKNKYEHIQFLEWDEYVKKYILTIDKYVKLAKSNGTVGNGNTATIKIDAAEIIYPKLQTGEGIIIE